MLKSEFIERSPLRILDKSIHGKLMPGCLGAWMSEKGVGKTACLVHLAIDHMLQDRNVLHISFSDSPAHLHRWYDNIFEELSKAFQLDEARRIRDQLFVRRVFLKFDSPDLSVEHIEKTICTIKDSAHFDPGLMIVDGYQFRPGAHEQLREFKSFVKKLGTAAWFSSSLPPGTKPAEPGKIPDPMAAVADLFEILIYLQPEKRHIRLKLVKDYDHPVAESTHLQLEPRTMLIKAE